MQGLAGSNDAKQYQKKPYRMPDEPIIDYGNNSLKNVDRLPEASKIPDLDSNEGLVDKRKLPKKTDIGKAPEEMVAEKKSVKKKKKKKERTPDAVDDSDQDIKNLVDEAMEL